MIMRGIITKKQGGKKIVRFFEDFSNVKLHMHPASVEPTM